jgi:hypothetical protein
MWFSSERSGAGSTSTGDGGHHRIDRDINASTSVELSYQRGTRDLCVISRPIVAACAHAAF